MRVGLSFDALSYPSPQLNFGSALRLGTSLEGPNVSRALAWATGAIAHVDATTARSEPAFAFGTGHFRGAARRDASAAFVFATPRASLTAFAFATPTASVAAFAFATRRAFSAAFASAARCDAWAVFA